MEEKFLRQLSKLSIQLNEKQKEDFKKYYKILVEWNKVMNLTGITEYQDVNEKHFVDSLAIVKAVSLDQVKSVIDVGTGAGFPGIPLKIVYPHLNVLLLDSLKKRVSFLNEVISELELKEIKVIHGRAEDFAKEKTYRETFDLCVSRAVANLSTLSEYCIPYIRVGGIFIAYKSEYIEEEINQSMRAVQQLGGKIEDVIKFRLPETEINRSFVKIIKINSTNKKYPRKAGMPAKEPLK